MSGFGGLEPIDFTGLQTQTDTLGSFGRGAAQTMQIQQLFAAQQAAQLAAQRKVEMEQYLDDLSANPNAKGRDYAQAALRYPEASAELKQAWDQLGPEQQANEFKVAGGLYAALSNGKPEIAIQQAEQRRDALRNSGNEEEALEYEDLIAEIKEDPIHARAQVGIMLAGVNPEKFQETFKAIGEEERQDALAPDLQRKGKSEADKAVTDAKYADQKARIDIAAKSQEIRASKEGLRLRAIEATIARDANGLKNAELQLKYDEAKKAVEQKALERVADADAALSATDNFINTADRILLASDNVIGDATGTIDSRIPTLDQDTADFEQLVETLKSQAFLAQIPNLKGLGQLSNAEGDKIQSSLQNLSLKQGDKQFIANVKEMKRLVEKGRSNIELRYSRQKPVDAPAAGGPAMVTDAPAGGTVDFSDLPP